MEKLNVIQLLCIVSLLLQRDPIDRDVRVLRGEVAGQALHADHVAVVDRGDRQIGVGMGRFDQAECSETRRRQA